MPKEKRFIVCKQCSTRNDFAEDGTPPTACSKCGAEFDFAVKKLLATIRIYTTGENSRIASRILLDPDIETNAMRGVLGELRILETMIVHTIIEAERGDEDDSTEKTTGKHDDAGESLKRDPA